MISAAIDAFCTMIGKIFDYGGVSKNRQSETNVNKRTKNLGKAVEAANKALDIASKYDAYMQEKDLKLFRKEKKKFDNSIGN